MEDRKKLRNLQRIEGMILALKNQVVAVNEEFDKLNGDEYNYETATDEEKEVMNRIIDAMKYINDLWNLRV